MLYETLLFVHILAAMTWVGGGIMLTVISARVDRSPDAAMKLQFTRASAFAGPVAGAAAMVVLAVGIAMVLIHDHWRLAQTWVWLALVLFFVSMAIGAGYFGRVGKRIETAFTSGDEAEGDRLSRQMLLVSVVDVLVTLVILGLMVFKPGA